MESDEEQPLEYQVEKNESPAFPSASKSQKNPVKFVEPKINGKVISSKIYKQAPFVQTVKPTPQPPPSDEKPKKYKKPKGPSSSDYIQQSKMLPSNNFAVNSYEAVPLSASSYMNKEGMSGEACKTIEELTEALRIEAMNSEEQRAYINVLKEILESKLDASPLIDILRELSPAPGCSYHDVIIELQKTHQLIDQETKEKMAIEQRMADADHHLQKIASENKVLKDQIQSLQSINQKANEELQNSAKSLEQAKITHKENNELKSKASNLEDEVEELTKVIEEQRDQLNQVNDENLSCLKEIKDLKDEIVSINEEKQKLVQKLSDLEKSMDKFSEQQKEHMRVSENLENKNKEQAKQILSLESSLKEYQEKSQKLKLDLTSSTTQCQEIENLNNELKTNLNSLQLKLTQEEKRCLELSNQCSFNESNYEKLVKSFEDLQEKNSKLILKVNENDLLRLDFEDATNKNECLLLENNHLSLMNDDLQKRLEKERQGRSQENEEHVKMLGQLRVELRTVHENNVQLDREKRKCDEELVTFQEKADKLSHALTNYEKEINTLRVNLLSYKEENMVTHNQKKKLENSMFDLNSEIENLQDKLKKIDQRVYEYEISDEQQKSRIAELINIQNQYANENHQLASELEDVQVLYKKRLYQWQECESNLKILVQNLASLFSRDLNRQTHRTVKLSKNTDLDDPQIEELIYELKNLVDATQSELDTAYNLVNNYKQELCYYQQENEELQNKLSYALREEKVSHEAIKSLQENLHKERSNSAIKNDKLILHSQKKGASDQTAARMKMEISDLELNLKEIQMQIRINEREKLNEYVGARILELKTKEQEISRLVNSKKNFLRSMEKSDDIFSSESRNVSKVLVTSESEQGLKTSPKKLILSDGTEMIQSQSTRRLSRSPLEKLMSNYSSPTIRHTMIAKDQSAQLKNVYSNLQNSKIKPDESKYFALKKTLAG